MRDTALVDIIARLARRKLMFVAALAAFAIVGVSVTNGWSWTTAVVTGIALFIVVFAWAMVSFWIWVFRNSGRPGDAR